MSIPTVFADFQNADAQGRLRLNCEGTRRDLEIRGIILEEGIRLNFSDDELETDGTVSYSTDENLWVATIDWDAIRSVEPEEARASERPAPPENFGRSQGART